MTSRWPQSMTEVILVLEWIHIRNNHFIPPPTSVAFNESYPYNTQFNFKM